MAAATAAGRPLRLLVTGVPGVGKTTLLGVVQKALPAEFTSGFVCREVRDARGSRAGFEMVALDGQSRGALASVNGPDTGYKVSKYHVQLEEFERFAFPLLDAVLAGGGGGGPRVFLFDEIGKMELFSDGFVQRVRRLLSSPDPSLHVLGTVALRGGGFIARSKELPGVEVEEICKASRDDAAREISRRFLAVLPATSQSVSYYASAGSSAPAATAEETSADVPFSSAGVRVRFDQPPKGQYSGIYIREPDANFASVNAGDYLLYVGGGAINRAFRDALVECGHQPDKKYEILHEHILREAVATPGKLHWVKHGSVKDWALSDLLCFCGLVPACPRMAPLLPVGMVSIAVFPPDYRPEEAAGNVAMVYTVGPNCGKARKRGRREVDNMSRIDFLRTLESIGEAIATAIQQYNATASAELPDAPPERRVDPEDGRAVTLEECTERYAKRYRPLEIKNYWRSHCKPEADAAAAPLPRIEVLRMCLLSGGIYKHPDATKLDIATALIRGLVKRGVEDLPLLDFAYDEDCFQQAWQSLLAKEASEEEKKDDDREASPH